MDNKRKVVLYIAQSLDGYIARENGDVDWLIGDGSDIESDCGYEEFYSEVDTIILGRTTYNQVINELSPGIWPYEGKESFVFTSKNIEDNENVKFIKEDICEFIKKLKKSQGKDIWIVGGGVLIDKLVKNNLIDDYIISIIPTILGNGLSLFKGNNPEIKFKLKESKNCNGIIITHYVKRKD